MNTSRRWIFPVLALWLALPPVASVTAAVSTPPPAATVTPRPWPQAASDLKVDPNAVWGTLPNGVRYVILPNKEPPGRLSLRLAVRAGSLMETDDQQGLAHFLEHMAFNGSDHFPPGELVAYFQRLGMSFGGDTNAHTSYDETVYQLDLPETSPEFLNKSLQLMTDYAGGLLLRQDEVNSERGVILSEKRDRDNVAYRTFVSSWDFYFPDGLIAKRHPIGDEGVIKAAQRDRFTSFYQKWYTPDRLTVVAVGDIKPEEIEPLIKQYFGSLPVRASGPDPDLGKYGSPGFAAKYHRDPEATATEITLVTISPFARGPDTAARRANQIRLDAAEFMISRRLERIARQPDAPISKGDAFDFTFLEKVDISGIETVCQPDKWQLALNVTEQELRRALDYGFTDAEVAEAQANLLTAFETASHEASTRKSRALANEIASSVGDDEVFVHPDDELALARPVIAGLTPDVAWETLKAAWGHSGRRLFVSGSAELPNADAALAAAYQQSAAVPVQKPAAESTKEFEYTSTSAPGQVVERKEFADIGIVQMRFANNVRVNLKRTDFEADKILVSVNFGGGKLETPVNQPALPFVADAVFTEGGLGKYGADELQRVLAGKKVGASFGMDQRFFTLGGVTNGKDLRLQLELLRAFLTDPGYRPEGLDRVRREFPEFFNDLRQNVEAVLSNEVTRFLAGGDPRFGFPTQAQAESVTLDAVRAWLAPSLKDSYMEISIVGDFDPGAAEAALAATFGTLPARAEKRADYAGALNVKFPVAAAGSEKTFTAESVIPKATATVYWPTCDMTDIQRTRRLNVLAEVFSDRLRIQVREQLGEAYSPYANNNSSDVFPGYGYSFALCMIAPDKAVPLADKMREIAAGIATGGVTKDEFDRAVIPLRKSLVEYRRNNSYWLSRVLVGSQAFPRQLEWARTLPTAYDGMTAEELTALAKEYYGPDHAVRVLVLPVAPTAKPAATPTTAAAP